MNETRSAIRYARSLFLLALEQEKLEAVSADMSLISNTIQSNNDLDNLLKSPIVKADQKTRILKTIFQDKICALTSAFIELIVKKRREMYIGQIAHRFVQLHLENNGIEEASLITAVPADASLRQSIIALVEKQSDQKVQLEEKVDDSIIGGFILRFGNKQIDASVKSKMETLRRNFEQNLFIKDY